MNSFTWMSGNVIRSVNNEDKQKSKPQSGQDFFIKKGRLRREFSCVHNAQSILKNKGYVSLYCFEFKDILLLLGNPKKFS